MRTHLDEDVETVRQQALHGGREENRLAQVAAPVVSIECQLASWFDGRADRDRGGLRLKAVERLHQLWAQSVHVQAVRGDVDLDRAAEDTMILQCTNWGTF